MVLTAAPFDFAQGRLRLRANARLRCHCKHLRVNAKMTAWDDENRIFDVAAMRIRGECGGEKLSREVGRRKRGACMLSPNSEFPNCLSPY